MLVDADMSCPRQNLLFGTGNRVGFAQMLRLT